MNKYYAECFGYDVGYGGYDSLGCWVKAESEEEVKEKMKKRWKYRKTPIKVTLHEENISEN